HAQPCAIAPSGSTYFYAPVRLWPCGCSGASRPVLQHNGPGRSQRDILGRAVPDLDAAKCWRLLAAIRPHWPAGACRGVLCSGGRRVYFGRRAVGSGLCNRGREMAQRIIAPTSKAGTFTLDQYIGQGWTLDQLLEHGYFVDRTPAPKPSNEFKPANKAPE